MLGKTKEGSSRELEAKPKESIAPATEEMGGFWRRTWSDALGSKLRKLLTKAMKSRDGINKSSFNCVTE